MSEINDSEEIVEGTFPINLKFIKQYQRSEPSLMPKYKNGTYHKGAFIGGSNDNLILMKCKDKKSILSIIQSCVFHWYHTYVLHPISNIMEEIICQHLY